jgi:hypothetical protein
MCRFATHGYCSTPCPKCDRRMAFAADRVARKVTATASVLMRSKPNAR